MSRDAGDEAIEHIVERAAVRRRASVIVVLSRFSPATEAELHAYMRIIVGDYEGDC